MQESGMMIKFQFLDRITFASAALAIGLNAFLRGNFHGLPSGASVICDFQYPVTKAVDGGPSFWITHSDPYSDTKDDEITASAVLPIR